ncbi:hypothetical protein KSP39_PZI021041 [Platanthera zijinensis]|uniref:Uncharacterized protein n=1 Tax=Platanthera zijinensis TaxID=2320716 RepID=A0AAP0FVP8_9ASPA
MDDENPCPPLLATAPKPSAASAGDELLLLRFRSGLKWCALDLSASSVHRAASYLTFLIFTILIPVTISLLLLPQLTPAAAVNYNLSFNQLVQLPESSLAAIAFFTLSGDTSGIRQLLLVDGLLHDSAAVRRGYAARVDRAFRYLAAVLLPSFSVELAHKAVVFNAPSAAPLWRSAALAAAVASWVYRTGVFLLVCVLFRLTCELQILRFEELHEMFAAGGGGSGRRENVEAVMFREHGRIRMQLRETSHMYRIFILGSLVTITVSQLGALLMVLSTKAEKNFSNSGDLVGRSYPHRSFG